MSYPQSGSSGIRRYSSGRGSRSNSQDGRGADYSNGGRTDSSYGNRGDQDGNNSNKNYSNSGRNGYSNSGTRSRNGDSRGTGGYWNNYRYDNNMDDEEDYDYRFYRRNEEDDMGERKETFEEFDEIKRHTDNEFHKYDSYDAERRHTGYSRGGYRRYGGY